MLAEIIPVILTYNEAANIGCSLERLTWAKGVVIVDSNSTADTLAITGRFPNVRTVQRPFDTHAQQWRFAVEETGIISDWVLRLDVDYKVEPTLRDEIAALTPAAAGPGVPRRRACRSTSSLPSRLGLPGVALRQGRGGVGRRRRRFLVGRLGRAWARAAVSRSTAASTFLPMVLNTSFNENEPVVCRPEEAINCFLRTKMDVLVLGDTLIRR